MAMVARGMDVDGARPSYNGGGAVLFPVELDGGKTWVGDGVAVTTGAVEVTMEVVEEVEEVVVGVRVVVGVTTVVETTSVVEVVGGAVVVGGRGVEVEVVMRVVVVF